MGRKLFIIIFFFFNLFYVKAQTALRPVLEREITLKISNQQLEDVLKKIGAQGSFNFSYSSELIDGNKFVSIDVTKKTVREVLDQLFKGKLKYKVKGNYLILTANTNEIKKRNDLSVYIINGYVIDEFTKEKIPSVSIYEKSKFISSVTNTYGYFSIKVESNATTIQLNINKKNYRDTTIIIRSSISEPIVITIQPLPNFSDSLSKDSVQANELPGVKLFVPSESKLNAENISDTLYDTYQVSFLPGLGTNYKLSGRIINDYSFNVLGGYSMGTRKAEFAGLFNIDRSNVKKFQLAGIFNAVGGNVEGFQLGGVFNLNRKNMNGFQTGGFGNMVWENQEGFQLAGFFNLNHGKSKGFHLAGFTNINLDTTSGVQFSGFYNSCLKSYSGLQLSGFLNSAFQGIHGTQFAGFGNTALQDMEGVQLAGFFNFTSKTLIGSQVAGFVNYAHTVIGTQIGLFNFSDSCTGIPIGLFSYVRSGYHQLEFSADELFYTNISIRSGVKAFHSSLFAGIRPDYFKDPLWHFGYGIGTTFSLSPKTNLDLDISSQHISKGNFTTEINLLNKFTTDFDFRISKHFSIATGPVLNCYLYKTDYSEYPDLFTNFKPKVFYSDNFNDSLSIKMWLGWKFSIRLF